MYNRLGSLFDSLDDPIWHGVSLGDPIIHGAPITNFNPCMDK